MTDHDLWQHLEAEFARVLGEVPKPKGPDGVQRWADTDEPVELVAAAGGGEVLHLRQ